MQDRIIGYLLGALDEDELARFEAELRSNPELQAQVRAAERSLDILGCDEDDIDPPDGLADTTCDAVLGCGHVHARGFGRAFASNRFERGSGDNSWSMLDIVVACCILLIACMLFSPAINNSRQHAQIASCQNNLRAIGNALIEYSWSDPNGYFPKIPERGKLSVAGMYRMALEDSGLLTDDSKYLCAANADSSDPISVPLPTMDEVRRASGKVLAVVQNRMGGDYGYSLGYQKYGNLCGIRNRSRSNFPIMSDSPHRFSCEDSPRSGAHRNVLFESGGVRVVCNSTECWLGDSLYTNDRGEVSPGIHDADAVIAPSGTAPIVTVSYQK